MNGFYLFKLRGIPVFISFWYVLLMGMFALRLGGTYGMVFAGVVTLSLLVHEFGHGFAARRYDLQPSILLHGWGGLCAHQPAERDRHDVFIIAMGPAAGLLLGALVFAGSLLLDPTWLSARPLLAFAIDQLIWVNLVWSVVNLIPLWPLDGGQLFNIGLKQKLSVETTHRITHATGLVLAGAAVLWAASVQSFFLMVLAGLLAFNNWARLRSAPQVRGKVPPRESERARELYAEALEAMARHDWDEAARLGHLMRTEPLSPRQLEQVWELLAVATTNKGDYEEARRYVERAPDTEPVRQARERCEAWLTGEQSAA